MSETLQDERKRRKTLIIFGVIAFVCVSLVSYYILQAQRRYIPPPPPPKLDLSGKADTAKDSWIARSTSQLQDQEKKLKDLEKALTELREKDMQAGFRPGVTEGKKPVSITSKLPPPPPPGPMGIPYDPKSAGEPNAPAGKRAVREKQLTNLIVMEKSSPPKDDRTPVPSPAREGGNRQKEDSQRRDPMNSSYIPAGSFVKAVLLTGVDAPSGTKGKGNPYPVLFRIVDSAQLPNRFRSDIRECFALGEAFGELSSERAQVRINQLTCVRGDGMVMESPVTGYTVGEDGKTGLGGRVVTKQGALLARSMVAGFLQGVAQAFNQTATIINVSGAGTATTMDPDKTIQASLGGGVSNAMEKLSKFYTEMAQEMFPVVEVNAGRQAEIVFIKNVSFDEAGR